MNATQCAGAQNNATEFYRVYEQYRPDMKFIVESGIVSAGVGWFLGYPVVSCMAIGLLSSFLLDVAVDIANPNQKVTLVPKPVEPKMRGHYSLP